MDLVKLIVLWLAGLTLVASIAAVAWARRIQSAIHGSIDRAEVVWRARAEDPTYDLLPKDCPLDQLDAGHGWTDEP